MKLPWVTREHHEETKRLLETRVAELCRENRELLDRLLMRNEPERHVVEPAVDAEPCAVAEQAAPQSYTTPFDSVLTRFDTTFRNGKVPNEFKARIN